jgi:hypothetical protein
MKADGDRRVGRDARTVHEPPGHDRSHRRCDKARTAIGRAGASCGGAARGKQTAQCSGLNAHKSDFGRVIRLTMTPRHRIAYIQLCTTWKVAAFTPAHGRGFFSQRPEFRMFFAELFSRRLPPTPRNGFADSVAAADACQRKAKSEKSPETERETPKRVTSLGRAPP